MYDDLPEVPPRVSQLEFGERLTQERWEDIVRESVLSPEEAKIANRVLMNNEGSLAWTDSERGMFLSEYIPPYKIPTTEHVPWRERTVPIQKSIQKEVTAKIRERLANGTYEPSQSSYSSSIFVVAKKTGGFRFVHNLQTLNSITIRDNAIPPLIDDYVENFAGLACVGLLDLYDGYGQYPLAEESRDLTAFQTSLGPMRLTTVPQGGSNSVGVFQRAMNFILADEYAEEAMAYLDDVGIKGPSTRYEDEDGEPERLKDNPGVRRYIYEYLQSLNRVLWKMKKFGGTFSGTKVRLCDEVLNIVGFSCSYLGRRPTETSIKKIMTWPTCRSVKEVRGFLGTVGPARNWVRRYAEIARPLTKLTAGNISKKDFVWNDEADAAFDAIKRAVEQSGWLRPIVYESDEQVYLAVDSSLIAVGWELGQDLDGKRRPARFGSATFNDRESRYSQAKLELYGVFRALKRCADYVYGRRIRLEVDAKYLIEMINNPEVPNAAMTRWLWFIHLFDLEIVHVPANRHAVVDGLSRRERAEEDSEEEDDEAWLDRVCGAIQVISPEERTEGYRTYIIQENYDQEWRDLGGYLETRRVDGFTDARRRSIEAKARHYFVRDGKIYRRMQGEIPREVIGTNEKRLELLQQAHEEGGHKGTLALKHRISMRFFWPKMMKDIREFVRTCDRCQRRDPRRFEEAGQAVHPSDIGQTWGIDLVIMPPSSGYRYVVIAREDVSKWVEAKAIKKKDAVSVARFILSSIITRYGYISRLKSDQGTEFMGEVRVQLEKFGIRHVRTSAYHPQANGVVERGNGPFKEALYRLALDRGKQWPDLIIFACWAERTTVSRTTGYTPYRLMMGQECILPFDLEEATFLVRGHQDRCSTAELLRHRIRQLQRRSIDVELARERLTIAREVAVRDHNLRYDRRVREPFEPGQWVLLRDSSRDLTVATKENDKWTGPMVVVEQTAGRAYKLRELDGAESAEYVSHSRLRPYYRRDDIALLQRQEESERDPDLFDREQSEMPTWGQPRADLEDTADDAVSDNSLDELAIDYTRDDIPRPTAVVRPPTNRLPQWATIDQSMSDDDDELAI